MDASPLVRELEPGEKIVWQGKPEMWPFVTMGLWHLLAAVPLTLAWGGFFIFLEIIALRAGSVAGALLLAPFVLFGLYLIGGRFWTAARCWRNTYYVITNKRVLIRLGTVWPRVTSLPFPKITSTYLQPARPGIGHISFNSGSRHIFDSIFVWQPGPSWGIVDGLVRTIPSFRYVREAETVYERLQSLLVQTQQS